MKISKEEIDAALSTWNIGFSDKTEGMICALTAAYVARKDRKAHKAAKRDRRQAILEDSALSFAENLTNHVVKANTKLK